MPTQPSVKRPSAKQPTTMPYQAGYCDAVMEFMGRGYSLTAFAGEIGASRADLLRWCDKYATFAAAVERAQARRARVLEDRLLAARGSGAFGAHMQALKTAAPDEWPDAAAAGARVKATSRGKPAAEASLDLPDNGRDADDVH